MTPIPHLRVARPSGDLEAARAFYTAVFGFQVLAAFVDHEGFDGIVLGHPESPYHLEFTRHRDSALLPATTEEDLLVFYLPDASEWAATVQRLHAARAREVSPSNPYWSVHGITVLDPDGYRIVVQNAVWPPSV